VKPIGICGPGSLRHFRNDDNGIVDERGVLRRDHARVRTVDRGVEFLLVKAADTGHGRDIVITERT